jgi:hypothetical protein
MYRGVKVVGAGINWTDFNEVVKGKVRSRFANAYQMCSFCAISVVLIEVADNDEVYFIFDRREGTRKMDMERIRDIVHEWLGADRRVKGIDFISRKTTVCLDPADYLASLALELQSLVRAETADGCHANSFREWLLIGPMKIGLFSSD